MRCYFLSKNRCALKLDGEFLGYVGNNPSFIELNEPCGFLEFIPLNGSLIPCRAQLNGDFCRAKNNLNVRIIDLCGDFLILPSFFAAAKPAKLFLADNLGDGVYASVLASDEAQAFIQTSEGSGVFELGECGAPRFELYNEFLLLTAKSSRGKSLIFLFDIKGAPGLILRRECDEHALSDNLTLTTNNLGVCKIQKREVITLSDLSKSYCTFTRGVSLSELNEHLLPYAFLEEVFLKANFGDYLSSDLAENKDFITEFIGYFEFFLPPLKNDGGIILIKKDKEKAEFLKITSKNGKIADLSFL